MLKTLAIVGAVIGIVNIFTWLKIAKMKREFLSKKDKFGEL